MPLIRRLPKRGFKKPFRVEYQEVNVSALNSFRNGSLVNPESLMNAGLISSLRRPVKILGKGELGRELDVRAHAFTRQASRKIIDAGGSRELLRRGN